MSPTNLEPIKQQILEIIQHDPDVKYIFLGWVTDQFVPKTDYSKLLEEMKALREASDKRWEENDKRWEQNETRWEQNNKRWEENNKRWDAADKRFDAIDQRFDQQDSKIDKGFSDLKRQIDRLGNRWGRAAEETFKNGLIGLVETFFDGSIKKWRVPDKEGFVRGYSCDVEIDIVMSNGQCVAVEIKSAPSIGDVTIFERTTQFYERQTGVKPDRKVMISPSISDELIDAARALGVELFTDDEVQAKLTGR